MIRLILLVEDKPMDLDLTRRAFERRHLANPLPSSVLLVLNHPPQQ